MAILYISQYATLGRDANGQVLPVPPGETLVATTPVTTSATSAQSAVFNGQARIVRLLCTGNCHVLFGSNPTATTSNHFLLANEEYFFAVDGGDRCAVIDA